MNYRKRMWHETRKLLNVSKNPGTDTFELQCLNIFSEKLPPATGKWSWYKDMVNFKDDQNLSKDMPTKV